MQPQTTPSLYPADRHCRDQQSDAAECCLRPFDRREGISIEEAAHRAGRDVRTLRRWCLDHMIGRRIAGGPWTVSVVALAMLLNGDAAALRLYLAGDRHSALIIAYFTEAGLAELPMRWAARADAEP